MGTVVDIYCRTPVGDPVRVGRIAGGGKVARVLEGEEAPLIQGLIRDGIDGRRLKHFDFADGEAFVRELPWALRGSMVWAVHVGAQSG